MKNEAFAVDLLPLRSLEFIFERTCLCSPRLH